MSSTFKRLYEQFQPENYDLTLDIDKSNMTFSGTVSIRGKKTGRPSQRITFHQKDLSIKSASLIRHDKSGEIEVKLSRINKQGSFDEVRLHSEQLIYPGNYTATLKFSGKITKSMHGIYPCFFKHENKDKTLVMTQFESHHAREAFPCIDEPEAKATFDLKLVTPLNESVLGNTLVKTQVEKNKRLQTEFETSLKMSTYLLAFAVGEIHGISGQTKDGITVNSWATVAQDKSHLSFANNEAIKTLEFFSDYFKTPFPLKKLDQLAVPDFESLAMENWGLITYREIGLLADPKNRSLSGEQLISMVIAHEISHQWFGNLVTMKWWDDLWLNESFASIMENIAPDALHPDWQQWEDFATGRVLSCSHRDIYKDVQPVGVAVKNPDEIMTLFDPAIVYAKGARILSMLREYVGEEDFKKGLHKYFKEYHYSNTTRHDLWKTLGSVGQQDIDKFMTPWISQSGQPILRVSRSGNKLTLKQKRFLMDGDDNLSLWPIPLLSDKELPLKILDKKSAEIEYVSKGTPMFNINGNGHYIVSYQDEADKHVIRQKVIERSVGSISRVTILNDMLLLARANEYALVDMLELIAKCDNEPRDAVWSMFSRITGQAQLLTDGVVDIEKPIKDYKTKLAKYWYDQLGWVDKPADDPNTKHLRSTALALSISGENKDAIKTALEMFAQAGSVQKLPAEQRAMVAGAAVRHGKPEYIDQLMEEYESSQNSDVQQSITSALCSTKDVNVAKKLIDWGLKETGHIRQQDIDHWFAYLMRNHYTRDLAWKWLLTNWDYLYKQLSGGKSMEFYVWYSSGPLSTKEWLDKFKAFFGPKAKDPALKRNIQIAFSEIEARISWRDKQSKDLIKYFKNFS